MTSKRTPFSANTLIAFVGLCCARVDGIVGTNDLIAQVRSTTKVHLDSKEQICCKICGFAPNSQKYQVQPSPSQCQFFQTPSANAVKLSKPLRRIRFNIVVPCHWPPLAVFTPRWFNCCATICTLRTPLLIICLSVGKILSAC